jgi:hypothetical protein
MPAAGPMNQQHDFTRLLVHIRDDLMNENPNNPLFQPHISGGRVPDGGQILRQTQQYFLVRRRHGLHGNIKFLQLRFEFVGFPQLSVPARLQLCRNEPIVRIDSFH